VRSRASSFKWEYPLLSLRSSSSFLRLLRRLLVTSISPFIFPSITCFRRLFLRKIWPIQLAFRFLFHVGYLYPYFIKHKFMTYGMEVHLHAFVASTGVEGEPLVRASVRGRFCRNKNALGNQPPYTAILPVSWILYWPSHRGWTIKYPVVQYSRTQFGFLRCL